jgi:glycosyltransferase involved in cell wall biosynthesis
MTSVIKIVLTGPAMIAVSGVTTHLNQLFSSALSKRFTLLHFQVGREGHQENGLQRIIRFAISPLAFILFLSWHRPAIVHLNTSIEIKSYWRDTVFLLIAIMLRCRVVYQVHGGALPKDFFSYSRILTDLLHWVLKQPDVIVLLAQVELDAYRDFVPRQLLEVVPNAINASTLVAAPLSTKPDGALQLIYLGRLAQNKGIFEILIALDTLIKEGRNLRLTIGGSGPDEGRLKAQVLALGLNDRVVFVGPVFGADKDQIWCDGHVFLFPTYHREGLPYALLEAMAAGAVPITTRVGAIPDVMQDGIHGLLVEAKSATALAYAIGKLDDDRVLLTQMAEAARARILEHYTVVRLADDFTRIYNALARGDQTCAE